MSSSNEILAVIWKRRRTFAIVFAVVLGLVAIATFTLPKAYTSSALLIVRTAQNAPSDFEATQSNQLLAKTYADLVGTTAFSDAVDGRLPFTSNGSVKVDGITDSQLIEIKATDDSPQHARTRANTYALAVVQRAAALEGGRSKSLVSVAQLAPLPSSPSRPQPKLYLLLGAVLAFFIAGAMALLRNRLDQRLHIEPTATEVLGLPIVARVPQTTSSRMPSRQRGEADGAEMPVAVTEAFRLLLANLSFANLGKRPRTLAVVSASEGEGKSTACLSLGRAAAELGLNTAVVDADLRRPSLRSMVHAENGAPDRGLSTLLVGAVAHGVDDVAVKISDSSLRVVAAGPVPPNPAALLGSDGLHGVEEDAKRSFDLTIFDTPPLSVGADASLVASQVEGVIFVLDVTKTRRTAAVQAVDQLRRAQGNVLGIVLNRVADKRTGQYYDEAGRRERGGRGLRPRREAAGPRA